MSPGADPPLPARLPEQLERATVRALAHEAACSEFELVCLSITEQHAGGVKVDNTRLSDIDVSGSRLESLRLIDDVLECCNLANIQARRSVATRVRIEACRMTGVGLTEATLQDVTVRDCRVDLASFSHSRLQRVSFESCMLIETDFLECQLESVRFERCDLSRADFRGARMQRCELCRNNLTDLQGIANLKGAAMEWPDIVEMAGAFARTIGIGVLDENPE
ncbi:MAG TPA: pentapeptide repeat-containing protein [Acidimicrobiales bacterium]|nr:pentapeptide repeat-containing protein [Acidimicrobiales bacterium]